MTKDKNFKDLVRSRMAETGESYSVARAALRARSASTATQPPTHLGFTSRVQGAMYTAGVLAKLAGLGEVEPAHLLQGIAAEVDSTGQRILFQLDIHDGLLPLPPALLRTMPSIGTDLTTFSAAAKGLLPPMFATAAGDRAPAIDTGHLLMAISSYMTEPPPLLDDALAVLQDSDLQQLAAEMRTRYGLEQVSA